MIVQLPGIQPEIAMQAIPDDERVWVPQAPGVWFRPLLLNTVTGSWCNLLRVRKRGVLSRHIHPSWVTGYVIRGAWRYLEHDWVAQGRLVRLRAAGRDPHAGGRRAGRRHRDDHLLQHPRRDGLRRRQPARSPATKTCSPRSRCAASTTWSAASARRTSIPSCAERRRAARPPDGSRRPEAGRQRHALRARLPPLRSRTDTGKALVHN